MKRGFTLVELTVGMGLMMLLVLGSMTMMAGSLRSFQRTDNDVTMTDQNARALRKVSETVRQAVSVSISNSGKTLAFNLPALSASVDPVTGEREVVNPAVSDGIARGYVVDFTAGTLKDSQTGKVLVSNIAPTDTDSASTLYGKSYEPFQLVTIGTKKAITINLITRNATSGQLRTMRMKTTAILRNVP